ncbi:RNA polymerase sigma factor [Polyangium fumosum]|uniref:Sigma-70 family RNA polymerase sigma factor n=1 Tax=Polyangium fumosum TaxID=889272 RepID=A0A4U1IQD5_9BACT|nr:sigma-70 family RNA polymerase sigma factor [Polyangium fumosum]TKC96420.1 sigma-70 family RNA polymerase sigma factor [Polyangium fumosum]
MGDGQAYTQDPANSRVQRVFVNALRNLWRYMPHPDGAKPWLTVITRNVVREAHRGTRRYDAVFEPDEGHAETAVAPGVSPERTAELREAINLVTDVLQDMPRSQVAVLYLVCVEERSHEEAGAALGISEDAAKMALSRARKYLRLRLGNAPFVIVPPVPLATLERRALLQRLFDYVYPFGHAWAALMAVVFYPFMSREAAPAPAELHAVATGPARVIAASAADIVRVAAPSSSPGDGLPAAHVEPPLPRVTPAPHSRHVRPTAPRGSTATNPEPFVLPRRKGSDFRPR